MRVATGKGNDARKILTYYRVNFGVRGPFRVLCDGALIHLALKRSVNLRDNIPALLGGPTSVMVTHCVYEELRSLGPELADAVSFARRLTNVPCAHGPIAIPAAECIAAAVANGNPKGLLLASTDAALLRSVRAEHGLPLVRLANETRVVLLPPSAEAQRAVAEREATKANVRLADDSRLVAKEYASERASRVERSAKQVAKRKRAKAPNPLSIKKPKQDDPAHVGSVRVLPVTSNSVPKPMITGRPAWRLTKREQMISMFATIDNGETGITFGEYKPAEQCEVECSVTKPKRVRKRKPKPIKPMSASVGADDVAKTCDGDAPIEVVAEGSEGVQISPAMQSVEAENKASKHI
jgi:U3 small nucleolar RNA-associated protein 23